MVLLLGAALLGGAWQAAESPSVGRFVRYYQAAGETNQGIPAWQRLLYSLALARAKA